MAIVPEKPEREESLAIWFKIAADLKKLKASEILMRKSIVKEFFPDPKEGVNKVTLSDGYVLEMSQPVDRKFDIAALDAMTEELWEEHNISRDVLVAYKPSLKVAAYRTLTEKQLEAFDAVLVIKNGSPTGMKVTAPKEP